MIIHNCKIVTFCEPNQILERVAVRVDQGTIVEFIPEADIQNKFANEEIINANGQLLMPGLICAHTHFYGAFSRGMAIMGDAPADFPAILRQLWWPLDQSLGKDDIYYSAMVCMIDAIKHGTTTLFDHHASPNFITGSLDVIENAFRETGLRGSICYEVTDRGGAERLLEGIAENVRQINKLQSYSQDNLVVPTFGLHASLTLSEASLEKCARAIPAGFGFHTHIAEHQSDQFESIKRSGTRVVDRMQKFGITGENSIFVHGVHIDAREQQIIADTRTWLTHQPRSNMNNAVGMANIESCLRFGIPVCLGNDGFSNAMWDEWRTCYLSHKLWQRDPRAMNGSHVMQMGSYNNAKMASHFFKENIGQITPGAKADLILVDYQPFTEMTPDNLAWHVLFGFRDSMVTMTMVNGNILMKDRKLQNINEQYVVEQARLCSKEVWNRYNHQSI